MLKIVRSIVLTIGACLLPFSLAQGTLIGAFDVGPGGSPTPSGPWYNTAGNTWISKIWSPLVSLNEDATGLAPQLAVSWEGDDASRVWTFHLRPDVRWHDGEAFTASDVKFTWEWVFAPNSAASPEIRPAMLLGQEAYNRGEADEIEGLRIIDDHTVEFTLAEPNPRFPNTLIQSYILPEHHLSSFSAENIQTLDWWFTQAVGTGPFQHSEFVPDEYWALVPHQDYWNGAPRLDRLINRYFADETAAVLALESGDVQFTYVSGDVATRLGQNSRYNLFSGPSGVTNYNMFNFRNSAFDDVRVRQAMLYAIDREAIAEIVLEGTAQVVPCIIPYEGYWPDEYNTYDYDPERARELLREAGWNTNNQIEIKTYYTSQFHADAMAAMQQFLSDVGINVTFIIDNEGYNSYFYDGRNWDISYRGLGVNMAAFPFGFYETGGYPGSEGDTQTLMGKQWPELEALFAQARTEADPDAYQALMQEICRFQNENAVEAYLWTAVRFGVASDNLSDFYWYPVAAGGPYEDHAELWFVAE